MSHTIKPELSLLNINKPPGLTSRDVVTRVNRLLGIKRAGHAGTLDPNATGVLVVLLGSATRMAEMVQQGRKIYDAKFKFGLTSSTDDVWGECKVVDGSQITEQQLIKTLEKFRGEISQRPPKISAVKLDGRRAYKLTRAGVAVDIKPRLVNVYDIELTEFNYPECRLTIECGSGTYIRSIARDLGELLECPAVMSSLVRIQVGPFRIENSVALDDLNDDSIHQHLLPVVNTIGDLEQYILGEEEQNELRYGRMIGCDSVSVSTEKLAAINSSGDLVAVLTRHKTGLFKPKINFLPNLDV